MIGSTNWKNLLTFGGNPIEDMDWGSLFYFPDYCGIRHFTRSISFSPTATDQLSWHSTKADGDNAINPQHFVNDPANFRIQINPEIWIQIRDHFWLRFRPWSRFVFSEHSLVFVWVRKKCALLRKSYQLNYRIKLLNTIPQHRRFCMF